MPGDTFASGYPVLRILYTYIGVLGASMTLVGLLPPMCDNGNMLVDGGYSEYLLSLLTKYTNGDISKQSSGMY